MHESEIVMQPTPSKKHPVVKLSQSYCFVGEINYSHYIVEQLEGKSVKNPHLLLDKSTMSMHYYNFWIVVVNIGGRV